MAYKTIKVPNEGDKIIQGKDGVPQVSDQPIIPFIEATAPAATSGRPASACSTRR